MLSTGGTFRWIRRSLLFVGIAAVLLPAGLLASDQFTDVANSNIFHDDINAIAGAGITEGCSPGIFCPSANITRQAEAAFLHRGLGRVAQNTVEVASSFTNSASRSTDTNVAQVTISGTTAIDPNANQFVEIHAVLNYRDAFSPPGTPCPCTINYYLSEGDQTVDANRSPMMTRKNTEDDIVPISWVRPAAPGSHVYRLYAFTTSDAGSITLQVESVILTAKTYAFGSEGTDTLSLD